MTRDGIYADSPALDAPMLWYVEQAVPDPRCTLASTICPSVNALVPQVYLPEGYAQALAVPTGGTISGENIKLSVDGQLRNTGQVVARDTLTVKVFRRELNESWHREMFGVRRRWMSRGFRDAVRPQLSARRYGSGSV
jgi:hypothetical protein